MEPSAIKRKLAAILMADDVSYSRLMGEDEAATVRTLKAYREVFSTHISNHDEPGGECPWRLHTCRVGQCRGYRVAAAVEIQQEVAEKNRDLPSGRATQFRIGINPGDVVVEE